MQKATGTIATAIPRAVRRGHPAGTSNGETGGAVTANGQWPTAFSLVRGLPARNRPLTIRWTFTILTQTHAGRAKLGTRGGSGVVSPETIAARREAEQSSATTADQLVDLTHHNKNRMIFIKSPEITIRPVAKRGLTRDDVQ